MYNDRCNSRFYAGEYNKCVFFEKFREKKTILTRKYI